MQNRSPNRHLSHPLLALTILLLGQASGQAQDPAATNWMRSPEATKQWAMKIQEAYLKTHKLVSVSVDYVDVPLTDFLKTSQWIAPGHDNDARLLAALVKAGAQDTQGARVQAPDRWSRASQKTLRELDLGYGDVIDTSDGRRSHERIKRAVLISYTEATPQVNADGTITVLLRLVLGPPPQAYPVPLTAEGYQCVVPTFRDGQTLLVSRSVTPSATGASLEHLTFVRAETSAKPDVDAQ